jgi:hypothetical protein
MSNTKHTSGPWEAQGYDVRQDGFNGTRFICYAGPHHTPSDEYPKSCQLQDEANARLIAAAPEMLDALEFILSKIYDGTDFDWRFACELSALIALAKGESL